MAEIGRLLAQVVDKSVRECPQWSRAVDCFRAGTPLENLDEHAAVVLREQCMHALTGRSPGDVVGTTTSQFVEQIGRAVGDVDAYAHTASWPDPEHGAPTGIINQVPLTGLFSAFIQTDG
jgi:hypothetical protein